MKAFNIPEFEVVYFTQKDIIVTSTCKCVDCGVCPPGEDNCQCIDFAYANQ